MTWVIAGWSFLMLAATWAWVCLAWTNLDRRNLYYRSDMGNFGYINAVPLAAHWRARMLFRKLPYPPEILELLK